MSLSAIVPALNEPEQELNATVKSLREALPEAEVLIVDDASSTPVTLADPSVRLIHNRFRTGGGAARDIGACHATGDWLFFTDSHVRVLTPDFKAVLEELMAGDKETLWCGTCLGMEETGNKTNGTYFGARLHILDEKEPPRTRVLTAKWRPEKKGEDRYDLSVTMGACYLINRAYFLDLGGLSELRGFGSEEEFLSMKVLLAGGRIRLCKDLKIGHRFRHKSKPPYRIELATCYYNTLTCAWICCPPDVAADLQAKMGGGHDMALAKLKIQENWHVLAAQRAFLENHVFELDWEQYLERIAGIDGV